MQAEKALKQQLTLKCVSLNVKGLNLPEKISQVLSALSKHKAHFLLFQETHFRSDAIPKLNNHIYQSVIHSTNPDSKTKGVSILISKHADFQQSDALIDPEGRYLFLKGTYASTPITLVNVYCPNAHQVSFFRKVCDLLVTFQEGIVLLGGDFNTPLNPTVGTRARLHYHTGHFARLNYNCRAFYSTTAGVPCSQMTETITFTHRHT